MDLLDECLANRSVLMAPVVLAELLSDPSLPAVAESRLLGISLAESLPGFWRRSGKLRAELIRRGCRPKLADTLIVQTCLDHKATLLTRDRDFGAFARWAGLKLI